LLTAFNDNAAITFLASQVPEFDPANGVAALAKEYAVVAGAVTGGGLTVIANAPNPAGQQLLSRYFRYSIAPAYLFVGALFPTLVMAAAFLLLQ
jgi:Na+/H+ antiporter NhaD/arsenite permease-like protein